MSGGIHVERRFLCFNREEKNTFAVNLLSARLQLSDVRCRSSFKRRGNRGWSNLLNWIVECVAKDSYFGIDASRESANSFDSFPLLGLFRSMSMMWVHASRNWRASV